VSKEETLEGGENWGEGEKGRRDLEKLEQRRDFGGQDLGETWR
jgi:hypothetical protein